MDYPPAHPQNAYTPAPGFAHQSAPTHPNMNGFRFPPDCAPRHPLAPFPGYTLPYGVAPYAPPHLSPYIFPPEHGPRASHTRLSEPVVGPMLPPVANADSGDVLPLAPPPTYVSKSGAGVGLPITLSSRPNGSEEEHGIVEGIEDDSEGATDALVVIPSLE